MITKDDLGFFARNGFLHVKSAIDADTCAKLVDHTWTRIPSHWSRSDPNTWRGVVQDSCHTADLSARRGFMKFQKGDLLKNKTIEASFGASAAGGAIAQRLIGHPLANMRIRGLYAIAPIDKEPDFPDVKNAHLESHPVQLVALSYLDDVDPKGGALLVWPGSHRDLYPTMGSKLEHVRTPEYNQLFENWSQLEPIEIPGQRGDMVIIHHRLLHAPSLNRSPKIRFAFLCDYQRNDYLSLCGQAPGADMWEDWPAIAALTVEDREAPCDFNLLPMKAQPKEPKPAGSQTKTAAAKPKQTKDPSDIRRGDASTFARARREGDIWFVLSDDAEAPGSLDLAPKGSDLSSEGASISINGTSIPSLSRYDIINRLDVEPGEHMLEIQGLPRSSYIRIIKIRLPFQNSELLCNVEVLPGQSHLNFVAPEA